MKLTKQEREKLEQFLNQINTDNNNCSGVVGSMVNQYQKGYIDGINTILSILNIK